MTSNPPTSSPSTATADALREVGLDPDEALRVVRTALDEDLQHGPDATTAATVPADAVARAEFNARKAGILAGVPLVRAVLDEVLGADGYEIETARPEGVALVPGETALRLRAPVAGLLTAERTALNLITHLSGVATATAAWVSAVSGTGCRIRDSRKTLPGLRSLQKYAVRCGGGINHRLGLGDAVLIKDNHVVAAGSAVAALRACREHAPHLPIEVEVSDVEELESVLAEGAELVLLDNFTPEQCARAVRSTAKLAPGTELEASGGLTLELARAYAETGVDYLAAGHLTHSSPALDIGLDM
jgi:nicotinate-nucleotide pyrophosphorylase (carboxylating)